MIDPDDAITHAREALHTWMGPAHAGSGLSDEFLAAGACAELRRRHGHELNTVWNPSACTFDARWTLQGKTPAGLEKPFSAENFHAARMLACIGLIRSVAFAKAATLISAAKASAL
jgi:hypothetical protein